MDIELNIEDICTSINKVFSRKLRLELLEKVNKLKETVDTNCKNIRYLSEEELKLERLHRDTKFE